MNPAIVAGSSRSITSTTAAGSSHGTLGNGSSNGSYPAWRVEWLATAIVASVMPW